MEFVVALKPVFLFQKSTKRMPEQEMVQAQFCQCRVQFPHSVEYHRLNPSVPRRMPCEASGTAESGATLPQFCRCRAMGKVPHSIEYHRINPAIPRTLKFCGVRMIL
jgi:hypothetical protein